LNIVKFLILLFLLPWLLVRLTGAVELSSLKPGKLLADLTDRAGILLAGLCPMWLRIILDQQNMRSCLGTSSHFPPDCKLP
jgi:hypothetical protein